MKSHKYLLLFFSIQIFGWSCAKHGYIGSPVPVSTFNVINAIANSNPIFVNSSQSIYSTGNYSIPQIGYESSYAYSIASGNSVMGFYQISDSSKSIFTTTIQFEPNYVYSLFLSGVNPLTPDSLISRDSIPYYGADSLIGIRFVNLCPGSLPMTVNIAGNPPAQTEFSGLGYRNLTMFKSYSAISNTGGVYNFEIRDQSSDSLLSTFTLNFIPFKNFTLVVSGSEDQSLGIPISVFQVNNF